MKKDNPFKVDLTNVAKEKIFYSLAMFPYPSGAGLHVGHALPYTANDIIARFKRMQGYTVLNPIGWDSFGLPTEGYAMKVGKPANEVTEQNVANFVEQCQLMDWSYDRDRELATSSPDYYKRTQRIFQKLYNAGLVYRKDALVNRCPQCQTVLANDQVVNGKCERCETEVIQKKHMQRFIKITDYAERLIDDLDTIDRPEETKTQQKYWIGKSEGAEIDFKISYDAANADEKIIVGTQHPEEEKRNTISAVVQRKSDGKFLFIKWKKHAWISPSIGGVDEGETPEAAAEREVLEETGYKVNAIKKLGGIIESHFFAENKNIRRGRYDQPVLLELVDETPSEVGAEEKEIQEPIWLTYEEALEQVTHKDNLVGFIRYMNEQKKITVFTTRPDTIYGVTAIVLAPENESLDSLLSAENKIKLEEYRKATGKKTNLERQQDSEEKSGIFSGVYAIHPLTNEQVPVWYADYVLPDYATGAVMFVPAHDERDFAFAKKHALDIKQVIKPIIGEPTAKLEELSTKTSGYAIVYDPKTEKYLVVSAGSATDSDSNIRTSFPGGTIEEGEDILAGTLREVQEETGYTNLKLMKNHDFYLQAYYYAKRKDQHRDNHAHFFLFELIDDTNVGQNLMDNEKSFAPHRYSKKELESANMHPIWMTAFNAMYNAYTGSGALINSGEFNDVENIEAKKAIIDHLEKNSIGRRKITYKLRDWSISRQRYWGCPIPFYYTFADNSKVPFFMYTEGNKAFQPGAPVTPRQVVQFVVKDKNTDQYCFVKRTHDGDVSTFFGGIESDEDMVIAAKRELEEEGGFADAEFIKELGEYHVQFYHPTKNRNQYSINHLLYFEVDRSQQGEPTDPEAKQLHEPVWMSAEEFLAVTKNDTSVFAMNWLTKGNPGIEKETDRYNAYNPHPDKSKWIANLIPEEELPVVLPLDLGDYKPAGKSPLADHATFPHYTAKDGTVYLRECDTLDTFIDSSFYYIRFADPKNEKELISKDIADKTLPVDFYIGGKEHTYGHLLYSRFIHKFLFDQGYVPSNEPFKKLMHQGFILGPDGRKMSKRRGNVINPSEVALEHGSDTLRTYVMFMGPIEIEKVRNTNAMMGVKKFLERVERLEQFITASSDLLDSSLHKTIKGVSDDIERIKFNTAVSKLMVFVNDVYDKKAITQEQLTTFLKLLAPFATKLSQQMREKLGNKDNIHFSAWPTFDPAKLVADTINLPVQMNGKMKGTLEVNPGLSQDEIMEMVKSDERWSSMLTEIPKKIIYVQDKIINIIL